MFIIRKAQKEDAPDIVRCHIAAVHVSAAASYAKELLAEWSKPFSEGRVRRYEKAIEGPNERISVAVSGSRLAGFGWMTPNTKELVAVYVHPEFGRKGVGRSLVKHLIAEAREFGLDRLHMSSSINAVSFYQSCGFRVIRDAVLSFGAGKDLPCVQMQLSLEPSQETA